MTCSPRSINTCLEKPKVQPGQGCTFFIYPGWRDKLPTAAQGLRISDLLAILNDLAPFARAESWDNVGLMAGDPAQAVTGILVGLDPTPELLEEALDLGCNTVITHHPLIFTPIKQLRTDQPPGSLLSTAVQHRLAIISCHTNLDLASGGVNDVLAARLGLGNSRPLSTAPEGDGFGRLGQLAAPMKSDLFLHHLLTTLATATLKIAGPLPATVSTVALCGGSGSELATTAREQGADLYLSSEIKHSAARWAEAVQFCIIDAGHYATENLVVEALVSDLAARLADRGLPTTVQSTGSQRPAFRQLIDINGTLTYFD